MKKLVTTVVTAILLISNVFAETDAESIANKMLSQNAKLETEVRVYKTKIARIKRKIEKYKNNNSVEFVLNARMATAIFGVVGLLAGLKLMNEGINEVRFVGGNPVFTPKSEMLGNSGHYLFKASLLSLLAAAITHGVVSFSYDEYYELKEQLEVFEDALDERLEDLETRRELLELE